MRPLEIIVQNEKGERNTINRSKTQALDQQRCDK